MRSNSQSHTTTINCGGQMVTCQGQQITTDKHHLCINCMASRIRILLCVTDISWNSYNLLLFLFLGEIPKHVTRPRPLIIGSKTDDARCRNWHWTRRCTCEHNKLFCTSSQQHTADTESNTDITALMTCHDVHATVATLSTKCRCSTIVCLM